MNKNLRYAEQHRPKQNYQLGAFYNASRKRVEFRLWAPQAKTVHVRLFRQSQAEQPAYTLKLKCHRKTGVWTAVFAKEDADGFFYEYFITDKLGSRIGLDPYAKAMDAFTGSGAGRAALVDFAKTEPENGWEDLQVHTVGKREDAVIYEVSVRDFTISQNAEIKTRPGSYAAFMEKLPYIKELGVTHIQLMPVLNFYFTNELNSEYEDAGTASGNNYNWGYDPHNYFTPEGWFSENPCDPYLRIKELKTLIKEIHRNDLGVLLDVVYNHTANTEIFDNIVPGYYYRKDEQGNLKDNSACGNDLATTHTMVRKLIVDSVNFWVNEYHVDGFRFDLMGLIDSETMLAAYETAKASSGHDSLIFIGEGWKMYNGPEGTIGMDQDFMMKNDSIAVFNDEFRDLVKAGGLKDDEKGFLTGSESDIAQLYRNLLGQPQQYYSVKSPGANVQYLACHDNLTLHDNIALNAMLDDAVPSEKAQLIDRIKLGNFLTLTSQGIAFLHAGQERGRTKPKKNSRTNSIQDYIHNSYDASDDINEFPWKIDDDYQKLLDFTKALVHIRRKYSAFRIGNAEAINKAAKLLTPNKGLHIAWTLEYEGQRFFMACNASSDRAVTIDLGFNPEKADVFVDGDYASVDSLESRSRFRSEGQQIVLQALSAIMLKY